VFSLTSTVGQSVHSRPVSDRCASSVSACCPTRHSFGRRPPVPSLMCLARRQPSADGDVATADAWASAETSEAGIPL